MPKRRFLLQLGWFAAYWLASIVALSVVAYAIRLAIF